MKVRGARVGLLFNPASVALGYRLARDVVAEAVGESLVALFGPQHGVAADVQDKRVSVAWLLDKPGFFRLTFKKGDQPGYCEKGDCSSQGYLHVAAVNGVNEPGRDIW